MIARDKLLHAGAGLVVTVAVWMLTGSAAIGFAASVFAGFAKELYDMVLERGGHVADPWDVLATAAPGFVLWLFTALPSA